MLSYRKIGIFICNGRIYHSPRVRKINDTRIWETLLLTVSTWHIGWKAKTDNRLRNPFVQVPLIVLYEFEVRLDLSAPASLLLFTNHFSNHYASFAIFMGSLDRVPSFELRYVLLQSQQPSSCSLIIVFHQRIYSTCQGTKIFRIKFNYKWNPRDYEPWKEGAAGFTYLLCVDRNEKRTL